MGEILLEAFQWEAAAHIYGYGLLLSEFILVKACFMTR